MEEPCQSNTIEEPCQSNTINEAMALMLREGVISKIERPRLKLQDGIILLLCGDDRYRDDIILFHRRLFEEEGLDPKGKLHVLAINGGSLWIPGESPANRMCTGGGGFCLFLIKNSIYLAGGRASIVSYSHLQCKFADEIMGISMFDLVKLSALAKLRVKRTIQSKDNKVYAALYRERPDGSIRSYVQHSSRALKWLKKEAAKPLIDIKIRSHAC